jgi:hypothetical protein
VGVVMRACFVGGRLSTPVNALAAVCEDWNESMLVSSTVECSCVGVVSS